MTPFRVAAFQRQPRFDDVPGVGERLRQDLNWCDAGGVDLAVFPECFLQGYGLDRTVLLRRALDLHGSEFWAVRSALAGAQTTAVLGVVERQGKTLYNTAVVLRGGELIGHYQKVHPNEQAFAPGTHFPVFEVSGWTFGINICNDANYPEAARNAVAQGAQVLVYPLNNLLPPEVAVRWRERSPENLVRHATENSRWVVSADVVGQAEGREGVAVYEINPPPGPPSR